MSGTFLAVTGGVAVASRGWKPGMLLNSLQCTGWPHNKELSDPKSQQCSDEELAVKERQSGEVPGWKALRLGKQDLGSLVPPFP